MKNGRLMFLYAQNYEGDFFSLDKDKKKNGVGAVDSSIWWYLFWAMMNKCWSQQELMHGGGVGDGWIFLLKKSCLLCRHFIKNHDKIIINIAIFMLFH